MHANQSSLKLVIADPQATETLAAQVAGCIGPGWRLFLSGDLGAGKTHFARALLRALGHTGRVPSPTFTLMEPYNLPNFDLYHFDFYRFSTENDWRDAGFDESIDDGRTAVVIEWPERAGDSLPAPDLWLRLAADDSAEAGRDTVPGRELAAETEPRSRLAALEAHSVRGASCLNGLADGLAHGRLAGVSFAAA